MPARLVGMLSSAYAKSEKGAVLSRSAATLRWPQVRRPRGSGSRRTSSTVSRASAPNRTRPRATWKGAYASVPTLISRKLKPQTTERTANRTRQSSSPPRRVATVVVVVGAVGEEAETAGPGAVGALMALTVLVSTS